MNSIPKTQPMTATSQLRGLDLLPLMGKGVKELYGEHAPGATVPPLIMSEFNMAQVTSIVRVFLCCS